MSDPQRYRLVPQHDGGLRIWQMPDSRKAYVVGIDTASGSQAGDFCCAAVVDIETRAHVATDRVRLDPQLWGKRTVRLGRFYNTAMLVYETWPGTHGLTAAQAAIDEAYPMIYRRRQETIFTSRMTDEIGWATTMTTKPRMIDFSRAALVEGWETHDVVLLREMLTIKQDENGAVNAPKGKRDDTWAAWSIALRVAALLVETGWQPPPSQDTLDATALWWQRREQMLEVGAARGGRAPKPWDGS